MYGLGAKGYSYVFLTIILTVYGQLIIKWQMNKVGSLPDSFVDKLQFLPHMLLNPWIISAFVAAFVAATSWMAAMTKLQLSSAYPFMSLAFVLVLALSGLLFHESITVPKVIGMAFIVLGIVVGSKG